MKLLAASGALPEDALERRLDAALEDSFPASDPPAVFGDQPEERDTPEGEYQ